MNTLDIARLIVALIWSALFYLKARSLHRVFFLPNEADYRDVACAAQALTSVMVIGFIARFYIAENSTPLFIGLYTFCAFVGLYKIRISWTYRKMLKKTEAEINEHLT
jgi:hypothetical protein